MHHTVMPDIPEPFYHESCPSKRLNRFIESRMLAWREHYNWAWYTMGNAFVRLKSYVTIIRIQY